MDGLQEIDWSSVLRGALPLEKVLSAPKFAAPRQRRIWKLGLTERQHPVVHLRALERLTQQETAHRLGISTDAVDGLEERAFRQLYRFAPPGTTENVSERFSGHALYSLRIRRTRPCARPGCERALVLTLG